MKTRILLADDHTIVRQGLKLVLDSDPELEVVGQAENGREAVRMAREFHPDVVLLDLMMPELSGLEAARQMRKACPQCKIIILSSYSDEECARKLILDGAAGYLVKQTAGSELLRAIREVRKGNFYVSPTLSRGLIEQGTTVAAGRGFRPRERRALTRREQQVLVLIAKGIPNKAIAIDLQISVKTVEKHRQQVMNKLDIHEAAGLTRYAISSRAIEASGTEIQPDAGAGAMVAQPAV